MPDVHIITGDLTDMSSLIRALNVSRPDEVYNLGAISFVAYSWENAHVTTDVTAKGVLNMLEAVRLYAGEEAPKVRFYQASSSEMFGKAQEVPQRESTLLWPRSPYGVAKVFGHYMTINYRESSLVAGTTSDSHSLKGGTMQRDRVVVTGGAGFLGSYLCERLLVDGAEALALDNICTGTPASPIDYLKLPIETLKVGSLRLRQSWVPRALESFAGSLRESRKSSPCQVPSRTRRCDHRRSRRCCLIHLESPSQTQKHLVPVPRVLPRRTERA